MLFKVKMFSILSVWKHPDIASWRRQWHPTPVLLPGKSHGWRSLEGCSPWGRKESDMTERLHFHFHALEKEMATHSSVLAWRIPGTGEPGGLPSVGSQSRTRLKRLSRGYCYSPVRQKWNESFPHLPYRIPPFMNWFNFYSDFSRNWIGTSNYFMAGLRLSY